MADGSGERLAALLLPYCRDNWEDMGGIDHDQGRWFAGAPPAVMREALTLAGQDDDDTRPNDQPPEGWLVAEADRRRGSLCGSTAPTRLIYPRLRIDTIVVPCTVADSLAAEMAEGREWLEAPYCSFWWD